MNKETGGPAATQTVFFVRFSSEDDGYCVYRKTPNEFRDKKYENGPFETYDEAEAIRRILQDNTKE